LISDPLVPHKSNVEIVAGITSGLIRSIVQEDPMNNPWGVARILLAIGLIAVGLAAMRVANETTVTVMLMVTYLILVVATIGAAVRRRPHRWLGFAIGGWAYFLPVFVYDSDRLIKTLPTIVLLAVFARMSHPLPSPLPGFSIGSLNDERPLITFVGRTLNSSEMDAMSVSVNVYNVKVISSVRVGHLFCTLLAALLGAVVAQLLHNKRSGYKHTTLRAD
jgi:hypothetical protein